MCIHMCAYGYACVRVSVDVRMNGSMCFCAPILLHVVHGCVDAHECMLMCILALSLLNLSE